MMRYFNQFPHIPLFDLLFLSLRLKDGAYIKWTSRLHFCMAHLRGKVYLEQPQGFEIQDRRTHVCRLKKALYGLMHAARAWYDRIDSYLMKLEFTRSSMLIQTYTPRLKRACHLSWYYILMIYFLLMQALSFINVRGS